MSATPPWLDHTISANGRPVRENFAAWFDASQAVDSDGSPALLFHGTIHAFDAFSKDAIGSNKRADQRGFFFTNCADTACYFAAPDDQEFSEEDQWGDAAIVPVFLSLQRPLRMDDVLRGLDLTKEDIFEDHDHVGEFFDIARPEIFALADKLGCDGIYLELEGFVQAVAFEPQQIKSAIGNSGLYVSESPSLTDGVESLGPREIEHLREVAAAAKMANRIVLALSAASSKTIAPESRTPR